MKVTARNKKKFRMYSNSFEFFCMKIIIDILENIFVKKFRFCRETSQARDQ